MGFINNDLINELGIDVFANLGYKQFSTLCGAFNAGLNETYIKLLKINPKIDNISYSCMENDVVNVFGYEFLANLDNMDICVDVIISLFKGLEKNYDYKFSMQDLKTLITNNQNSVFNIDNYFFNFYYLSEEDKRKLLDNSHDVNELAEKLGIFSKEKKLKTENLYNNPYETEMAKSEITDNSPTIHKLFKKFFPRKK